MGEGEKITMLPVAYFIAVCLSIVAGLKLSLLEPNERTMWTTGADVEVFWKIEEANEDHAIKTIDFDLMQGRSKRPELVDNIAFGVEWNHGDAFWTVNPKLPTGDDYFVRITSPDDKDFVHDSCYFTIKEGSGKGDKELKGKLLESASSIIAPQWKSLAVTFVIAAAIIF